MMKHTKMDKIRYQQPGGEKFVAGTVWFPKTDKDICKGLLPCKDDDCPCGNGRFVDFDGEDIDELISALKIWKGLETIDDPYKDDELDDWVSKREELENKWYYKVYEWFATFTFTIRPFDWKIRNRLSSKFSLFFTIPSDDSRGITVGPFQFTTPRFYPKKDKK